MEPEINVEQNMHNTDQDVLKDFAFDPKSPRLKLIAGDASDRKFYRYQGPESSYICMQFPSWAGGYGGDPLSWIGMHETLKKWNIPLPEILKIDEQNACIWTSDLGDDFLNRDFGSNLLDATKQEYVLALDHYRQALKILVKVQYPPENRDFDHPARDRFFDETKLFFELNFFGEHFLKGLLGQSIVDNELLQEWHLLAANISSRERVLCHRDYHARNLMIKNNIVFWIDFQDARMGPHCYDVVSLLRDSYVKIEEQTREILFNTYLDDVNEARHRYKKDPITPFDFFIERQLVGLQRNIKALGSFAYLYMVKKKKVYLSFVTHTLETILNESQASEVCLQYPLTFKLLNNLKLGKLNDTFQSVILREKIDQF